MAFAFFEPTNSATTSKLQSKGHDGKDTTNQTSISEVTDSSTVIQSILKSHQSEMKEMMKKVNSLEENVKVLNDRVGRQENEIVALKSIVSHHQEKKERQKREVKPLSTCPKGLACVFDTSTNGNSASSVAQSSGNNQAGASTMAKNIGNYGTRSTTRGVHFYVQRNTTLSAQDVVVDYQVERLNGGNTMNLTSGIFTAPISGIYAFFFSTVKGQSIVKGAEVYLYHNDEPIAFAYGSTSTHSTLTLHSLLELKSGDKIHIFKGKGDHIHSSTGNNRSTTHFAGWLLEGGFYKS